MSGTDPETIEIQVKDLYKSFGDNHVLRGVDFTVMRGGIIALVGGSGCGKTVPLNHILEHFRTKLTHSDRPFRPMAASSALAVDELRLAALSLP